MIHTIRWMVSREPSSQQKRVAERILPLFLLGGLVGGAVAGVVTAFFARILLGAAGGHLLFFALASSIVAVAYMGRVVGLWNIPKISFKHQVPEAWRNMFRPQTASLIYSTALGFTFPTRISSYAVYPLVVLLLGLGQWPWIVVSIFAVMGLTRAATALLVPIRGWSRHSAESVATELTALSRISTFGVPIVLGTTAVSLLVWALVILGHG
jgi:hypothetical protein